MPPWPLPDHHCSGTISPSTDLSTAMNRELPKRARFLVLAARISVCALLAFSFVISSISLAGATTGMSMSCCIGKAAGHCSAGLHAKVRVQPKPEPMCGLKTEVVEVTAAEELAPNTSQPPANSELFTARVAGPCRQDCCTTSSALSRKSTRREASAASEANGISPTLTQSLVEASFAPASKSADVLSQSPPRGPPISR
jgi:hypothetical protein